tara:strand:- start:208 stop:942 length:735 start_codon:yes stop_codon:yes gene_type:complete
MIAHPQIFIFYLPGMFGTLLANSFMHHELLINKTIESVENNDKEGQGLNAHGGAYKDFIRHFHNKGERLFTRTKEQNLRFFSPLENKPMGVHRLCDYKTSLFDFEEYFSNTVNIILFPKNKNDVEVYGHRSFYAATNADVSNDFFFPQFKKGTENYPKYLIHGLGIKQRQKFLLKYYEEMINDWPKIETKNIITFDPRDFNDLVKVQNLCDDTCDNLGISKFKIPTNKIQNHLDKNSKWFEMLK